MWCESQELTWVRQMGGTDHDYSTAMAVDHEGNAYVMGNFEGAMTLGSWQLESPNWGYCLTKLTSSGDVVWASTISGPTWVQCGAITVDPAGFLYVTGSFPGMIQFGTNALEFPESGPEKVFLAKYDLDGALLWAKCYGGTDITGASSVAVSDDGAVLLAGTYRKFTTLGDFFLPGTGVQHAWVAKLDGEGTVQWASSAASSIWLAVAPKLTIDPQGNALMAGGFIDSITFPKGVQTLVTNSVCTTNQVLVTEIQWMTNFVCFTNFDVDPPELIRCTNIVIPISVEVVSNVLDCVPVPALSNLDGSFQLTGLPAGHSTMFLAKYAPSGRCLWARDGGGPATDVVVDTNGEVYVTGSMQWPTFGQPQYTAVFDGIQISGNNSCFLARFDAAGHLVWVNNEGGAALTLGPGGELYASGQMGSSRSFGGRIFTGLGPQDIFVSRYDGLGNGLAAWRIGDIDRELAGPIAATPAGDIFVLGSTYHESAANVYQQTNHGGWDILLAKLARQGPQILRQPQRVVLHQGEDAEFCVEVTNALSPRFEWLRNGTALTNDARLSGSQGSTLRIRNAELADEADYNVRITADNGEVLSSVARLRIEGLMQFTKCENGLYGEFVVSFTGTSGHLYDVEVSTDCQHWNTFTNGFCIDGKMTVSDFSSRNSSQRFYRAVAH